MPITSMEQLDACISIIAINISIDINLLISLFELNTIKVERYEMTCIDKLPRILKQIIVITSKQIFNKNIIHQILFLKHSLMFTELISHC